MISDAEDEVAGESRWSLWLITFGPVIWAAHFLICYATVSIWCAKVAGRDGSLGGALAVIAVLTAVALAAIAVFAWRAHRRRGFGGTAQPHDFDSPASRHRFLGFAAFLLACFSGVATIFTAIAAAFFRDCR